MVKPREDFRGCETHQRIKQTIPHKFPISGSDGGSSCQKSRRCECFRVTCQRRSLSLPQAHINSISRTPRGVTRYRSALTPDSELLSFLQECTTWLETWQVFNKDMELVNNRLKFIDGWLGNIKAVKILVEDFAREENFSFLLTFQPRHHEGSS